MPRGNSQTQMSKNMKEPVNGSKTVGVARGAKMDLNSANSSTSSITSVHSASGITTTCKDLFEAAKMGDVVQAKILRDKGKNFYPPKNEKNFPSFLTYNFFYPKFF